jgi:hypothetical protein
LLVLRRTATEHKDLAFPLDNFTVATNRLYRRSDLHNSHSQKLNELRENYGTHLKKSQ